MRNVAESTQISLPVEVRPEEVMRKQTLGASIDLCRELIGKEEKEVQDDLGTDKAQFSRWKSGQEGIVWAKFVRLMDLCGNDAPLLWMVHQRGYDLYSLRRRETETERENRLLREENAALRRVLSGGASA
jgi:plasmid maintenance system antidote protein VapI